MTSLVFLLYALGHLILFAGALALLLRHRQPATVPLLIVTFGLVYDNAMLASGGWIGHGELLERLSVPRFFMHAFGTPLLILTALGFVQRTGQAWTRSGILAGAAAVLTILMIGVGVERDLVNLELVAKQAADLVSYGNAAAAGPPVAPSVTIIALIAAGAIVGRSGGGPWLLAGAIAQSVAASLGDAVVVAGNLGELALLTGMILTDRRLSEMHLQERLSS